MRRVALGIVAALVLVGASIGMTRSGEKVADGISSGSKGPLIFVLHETLNEIMRGETVHLGEVKLKDDSFGPINGVWMPIPEHWKRNESKWNWKQENRVFHLPNEDLIDSYGIYGPQTSSLVALFQISEDIAPTGQVDANTLQHLRPLLPVNRPLLNVIMQKYYVHPENHDLDEIEATKLKAAGIAALIAVAVGVIVFFASSFAIRRMKLSLEKRREKWGANSLKSRIYPGLLEFGFFQRIVHLAPAVTIFVAHWIYPDYWMHEVDSVPWWHYYGTFLFWNRLFLCAGTAYLLLSLMMASLSVIKSFEAALAPETGEGRSALQGIMRFAHVTVIAITVLVLGAILTGINPATVAGSLGALMAVFVLLFRDSLLGLVATIKIVGNRMVAIGDWIEMPTYSADGDVISITLSTVKVQNFDKTISSIPTPSLLTDSFKNWSGMQKSGGRRIKRSIYIDMKTVRQINEKMADRFEGIKLLTKYMQSKRAELREQFLKEDVVLSPLNGRWLTNIGTFRIYLTEYLRDHSDISPDLTILVRQLSPTAQGLPLEIYAFTNVTDWDSYERIQSDIFDHILSVLPEFELGAFQHPAEFNYEQRESLFGHRINAEASIAIAGGTTEA